MESDLTVYRHPRGRGTSALSDAQRACSLKPNPILVKFDRQGSLVCFLSVGLGIIKQIISRCFSLGKGRASCNWPRGVAVSTLDSESSDRGSDPREASMPSANRGQASVPLQPPNTARGPTSPAGLSAQNLSLPPAARAARQQDALWPSGYSLGLRDQRLQARVLPGSCLGESMHCHP